MSEGIEGGAQRQSGTLTKAEVIAEIAAIVAALRQTRDSLPQNSPLHSAIFGALKIAGELEAVARANPDEAASPEQRS